MWVGELRGANYKCFAVNVQVLVECAAGNVAEAVGLSKTAMDGSSYDVAGNPITKACGNCMAGQMSCGALLWLWPDRSSGTEWKETPAPRARQVSSPRKGPSIQEQIAMQQMMLRNADGQKRTIHLTRAITQIHVHHERGAVQLPRPR